MKLGLRDTLAILDLILEKQPASKRAAGFPVRLRRLRDLVAQKNTAEPALTDVLASVFPGIRTAR